jgi:hypothetical protein
LCQGANRLAIQWFHEKDRNHWLGSKNKSILTGTFLGASRRVYWFDNLEKLMNRPPPTGFGRIAVGDARKGALLTK